MGFYLKVAPGVRIRATKRGLRTSVGPRGARVHFGAGGTGVSTGAGPFSYYHPVSSRRRHTTNRRASTGRSTRALASASGPTPAQQQKAAQAQHLIAAIQAILDIHRAEFPAATRPVAPPAPAPTYAQVLARHEELATAGIGAFHPRQRAQARAQAQAAAAAEFADIQADAGRRRAELQAQLDQWWDQLQHNEAAQVMWAITDAFEDNEAAAAPLGVDGSTVSLVVHVPTPDVLPDRIPGTTAAGNLSLRLATKAQTSDLYKLMVCGYALVTVKEAFAVAPGITEAGIVAVRQGPPNAYGDRRPEPVAAIRIDRDALAGIRWDTADSVQVVNDAAKEAIFSTAGAGRALQPLDVAAHPDIQAALETLDLREAPE